MTKNLSLILLLTVTGLVANAQSFSLRVAGGYAWGGFIKTDVLTGPKVDPFTPSSDALIPMADLDYFNDSAKSYKPVKGSYGQGMNFTIAPGYNINPYFGVELGISYLKSATFSANQRYQLIYEPYPGAGFFSPSPYDMTAKITTNAWGVSLSPAIVVQAAKPGWKVYPYGRLGISLPIAGGLKHTVDVHVQDEVFTEAPSIQQVLDTAPYFLGNNTKIELETHGTVSLGINGALGVAYKPLPYLAVTLEVNGQYLVTRAKSSKVTKWDADGESKLTARGKYRTEFNFVDELNSSSNNADFNPNYDRNKPKDDIRPVGPFSNLGINIGVVFYLSKQTLAKPKPEAK